MPINPWNVFLFSLAKFLTYVVQPEGKFKHKSDFTQKHSLPLTVISLKHVSLL
jgi:hypothetical protein